MNTIENVRNRSEVNLMQLMLVQRWLIDEKKAAQMSMLRLFLSPV